MVKRGASVQMFFSFYELNQQFTDSSCYVRLR